MYGNEFVIDICLIFFKVIAIFFFFESILLRYVEVFWSTIYIERICYAANNGNRICKNWK